MESILRFKNNGPIFEGRAYEMGEGLIILEFYGTSSKTRKLAYENSFESF